MIGSLPLSRMPTASEPVSDIALENEFFLRFADVRPAPGVDLTCPPFFRERDLKEADLRISDDRLNHGEEVLFYFGDGRGVEDVQVVVEATFDSLGRVDHQ